MTCSYRANVYSYAILDCVCSCVYVCSIYALLMSIPSSHLKTLIKCYYRHKHFHLLNFYCASFASPHTRVCVYEQSRHMYSTSICTVCVSTDLLVLYLQKGPARHRGYKMSSENCRNSTALQFLDQTVDSFCVASE